MSDFLIKAITWIVVVMVNAAVVWLLWNAMLPAKFGLPLITYGESIILCVIGQHITAQ